VTVIRFELPLPPSANRLYKRQLVRRGDGKMVRPHTKQYAAWRQAAGQIISIQRLTQCVRQIHGPYELVLTVARNTGDLGNREKACSDVLEWMSVIDNDRKAEKMTFQYDDSLPKGTCIVEIRPA
jgi:hypothetical protein